MNETTAGNDEPVYGPSDLRGAPVAVFLAVHVNGPNALNCPRCLKCVGKLEKGGNALALSESAALFYRARVTCRACGCHFWWTPERDRR